MKRLTPLCMIVAALVLTTGDAHAARAKNQRLAYQPLIVCGTTGCFEVPPGCRGQMRRVGKGVTAVVICDRK